MFKKFSLIVFLSVTLLLGGVFNTSAHAAKATQPEVQTYSKVYYSINGNVEEFNFNNWNSYLNNYFKTLKNKTADQDKQQTEQKPVEPEAQAPVQKPVEQPVKAPVEKPAEQSTQAQVEKPVEKPAQQSQNQSGQLNQFEQEVFDLTNKERTNNGLSPLKIDLELSRVAREKSQDMANKNYFDHNSPTYGSPFDMMKAYGISYRSAGENIAKGQRTPAEVVNAWMNSPGHRANILKADFTHIGVGYVAKGDHWTQQFIGR